MAACSARVLLAAAATRSVQPAAAASAAASGPFIRSCALHHGLHWPDLSAPPCDLQELHRSARMLLRAPPSPFGRKRERRFGVARVRFGKSVIAPWIRSAAGVADGGSEQHLAALVGTAVAAATGSATARLFGGAKICRDRPSSIPTTATRSDSQIVALGPIWPTRIHGAAEGVKCFSRHLWPRAAASMRSTALPKVSREHFSRRSSDALRLQARLAQIGTGGAPWPAPQDLHGRRRPPPCTVVGRRSVAVRAPAQFVAQQYARITAPVLDTSTWPQRELGADRVQQLVDNPTRACAHRAPDPGVCARPRAGSVADRVTPLRALCAIQRRRALRDHRQPAWPARPGEIARW